MFTDEAQALAPTALPLLSLCNSHCSRYPSLILITPSVHISLTLFKPFSFILLHSLLLRQPVSHFFTAPPTRILLLPSLLIHCHYSFPSVSILSCLSDSFIPAHLSHSFHALFFLSFLFSLMPASPIRRPVMNKIRQEHTPTVESTTPSFLASLTSLFGPLSIHRTGTRT